jgi:hypothetical protein
MAEDDHRPLGESRDLFQEECRAGPDLVERLPVGAAVGPEVPIRPDPADLAAGDALEVAIVPFDEERLRDRLREARQLGGAERPLERARIDRSEALPGQPRQEAAGPLLALGEQRDVAEPGVAARLAPLGLTVADREDIKRPG